MEAAGVRSGSAQAARLIARGGLEVSAFSSSARMFAPTPEERARHLDEVRQYARLCGAFGARFIRVFGGPLGQTPPEQAYEIAAAAVQEMARAVGPASTSPSRPTTTGSPPPCWPRSCGGEGAQHRRALDLHHPCRMKGESPRQTFDNIGRWTVATHLKDSAPRPTQVSLHPAGEGGDVPLAEMVRLLRAGGYGGDLTLEWRNAGTPTWPSRRSPCPRTPDTCASWRAERQPPCDQ